VLELRLPDQQRFQFASLVWAKVSSCLGLRDEVVFRLVNS